MKKFHFLPLFVIGIILFAIGCFSVSANESTITISYYDTAELSYGSVVLPQIYANHSFYAEMADDKGNVVASFDNENIASSWNENETTLTFYLGKRLNEGIYTLNLTIKNLQTHATTRQKFSVDYAVRRPLPTLSTLPQGQQQYNLFFEHFLVPDDASFDISLLTDMQKMVATTYLDFSSENLVGNLLTKTASQVEGYSFVEMVTLFQTATIDAGNYQLYFNIEGRLLSYPDTCSICVTDQPIIEKVSVIAQEPFLYNETQLLPMISGANEFDIEVLGFQVNPNLLKAYLYNSKGERVAKSVSCSYQDTLTLGHGVINSYQKETGIQAFSLHMQILSSAILEQNEQYRISLSYEGTRLYGNLDAKCTPQSELFVVSATPFDLSSIALQVVNFSSSSVYDIYLYDDSYGEIYCGTFVIPDDGFLELDTDSSLTGGTGILLSSEGEQTTFFYKNSLSGLFVPQKIEANPIVLHPTTTEFVAHFTMTNYSIAETSSLSVSLVKLAQIQNGEYTFLETPETVATSTDIKSVVRSRQDNYYNTDILIEMSVTSALDENALYSYLLNIDGHPIDLSENGGENVVYVVNDIVQYAELLDKTIFNGIPVSQNELYFWCSGVVVRDPQKLQFFLIDESGQVVANLATGSLTSLSMEAEQQFCGKLNITVPLQTGALYYLTAQYENIVLYQSEAYIGDDTVDCAVLVKENSLFSVGTNEITVYSQLINIPVQQISFEIVDFLKPYETIAVLGTLTAYNYDTYYQWKHSLILDTALHEGVYKVILKYHNEILSDVLVCISSGEKIKDVVSCFADGTILGYDLILEDFNADTNYGFLIGKDTLLSERTAVEGKIHFSREELADLPVGNYEILLLKENIPITAYNFYFSPFRTALEINDGNILGGELDKKDETIRFTFSQPLNINTISSETVQLLDPDGIVLPIKVSVSSDRYQIFVSPQFLLREEVQYTLVLTSSIQSIYYGYMDDSVKLSFFIRSGEQEKNGFFVPKNQYVEVTDHSFYTLLFSEASLDDDAFFGIWSENTSVDLSAYCGMKQKCPILEITDYKENATFRHPVSLAITCAASPDEIHSFVLFRYNPQTGRYERESNGTFSDGKVYASVSGCGRYLLCTTDTIPFTDVLNTWSESYVKDLWYYRVVSGYTVDSFAPDAYITRSEFVKMLVSGMSIPLLNPNEYDLSLFRDYGQIEEWALPYWATAYQMNIIKGTSFNTLSPNDFITRAEIVTMISRAKAFENVSSASFADSAEIPDWAKTHLFASVEQGVVSGYLDGTVRPNGFATRAETAKMISVMIHLK